MLSLAMAQLHGYEILLMVLGVILPLAVALQIWRAGLAKEYGALLRYNLATATTVIVGATAMRFTASNAVSYYCYVYWPVSILTDICALAVMLQVFRDIFKPYEALRQFGVVLFRWTLGVLIVVSIVTALSAGEGRILDVMNKSSLMFDRGLQILQCGIVLFLLLTYRYLGISFRHRVFGIAVGFGLYAAVDLLTLSISTWAPANVISIASAVANASAMIGYSVWLAYFLMPEPERRMSDALPESRRWEYALASIQAPAPEGMFLSSIDRTVERLLTKNNVATQSKPKEDKHWFGD